MSNKLITQANARFYEDRPDIKALIAEDYGEVIFKKNKESSLFYCSVKGCSNTYLRSKNTWMLGKCRTECKSCQKQLKSLREVCPEKFKALHPTLNEGIDLEEITSKSNLEVWWQCGNCEKEFKQIVFNRVRSPYTNCHFCKT